MNSFVASYLIQEGITNGAIYCLLAVAILLVFSVTRIIFIPQGEFVSYAALTYAALREGKLPGTVGFTLALVSVMVGARLLRGIAEGNLRHSLLEALKSALLPLLVAVVVFASAPYVLPAAVDALLAIALVTANGPLIYAIVYQPLAKSSTLVLLIVSMALHLVLVEFGLFFFGPGGARTEPLLDLSFSIGSLPVPAQSLAIYLAAAVLILGLFLFSERTLYGKALRAAAINPLGARLMGVSSTMAGSVAFAASAFIGAVCGVLVSSVTTIYYDTGFVLGLKGFVAAVIGGFVSYPLAALGALAVGLMESFSAFYASQYKETIVFTLIIPVLLWRSMRRRGTPEEDH
ncbi:MAG: branched-chain amino acid ABC transporter permease [Rhodopseudomonas sp.]|uniref:branched-chain amino acid ABC transporter permease n=1 Tax=Rhodopseudomonas sp. TaxID=1078 RepID=UPI001853E027|nr:branched-chain amino acid ABC transporter permease [Rhodopseudomonas sp.]NVN85496.1 branched-chain amino acid ABC transporter permease [Rhodopseudomonas sp.]